MKAYNELADATRLHADRYAYYARTKVGGWASYIQHSGPPANATFVFQVGTEPKAHWAWGDAGTGFFFLSAAGEWMLSWECY
ncbi:MAG: hypothetical protein AAGF95_14530 [Chloroflexota bacterium]